MDGGCVLFAQALISQLGGELMGFVDSKDIAQHAVCLIAGNFIDYRGIMSRNESLLNWNDTELVKVVGYRRYYKNDLCDAIDKSYLNHFLARLNIKSRIM